jgi:hypothetical protein
MRTDRMIGRGMVEGMRTLFRGIAASIGALLAIACGSSDGGGGPAGVDRSAPIASIGTSELGEICDWANARLGGYGRTEKCSDGRSFHTFASHDECAAHPFPLTCMATVGQYEDCVTALTSKSSSLCASAASTPPVCQALLPSCTIMFG